MLVFLSSSLIAVDVITDVTTNDSGTQDQRAGEMIRQHPVSKDKPCVPPRNSTGAGKSTTQIHLSLSLVSLSPSLCLCLSLSLTWASSQSFLPPPHAVLSTPPSPPTPTLAPSAYPGAGVSFFIMGVLRTPLKRRETNLVAFHLLLTTLPPAPIPVSVSYLLDIIILPPVAQAACRAWGWGGGGCS